MSDCSPAIEGGQREEPRRSARTPGLTTLDVTEVLATVEPLIARRLQRRGLGQGDGEADAPDARANGFDLHAGLVVPAGQQERLERIVRYALRPPVTQERLHLTNDGQVRLELRQRWRDGTTAIVFDHVEFLGRLAVLVPRPRINLLLYAGTSDQAGWDDASSVFTFFSD